MACDYSENILIQESAGHLLHDELGWNVVFAYNQEKLGLDGSLFYTLCQPTCPTTTETNLD